MSVLQLFILAGAAILLGQLKKGRTLALLAGSVFTIYWLQPVQSPANLTFWLPTITLLLTIFSWQLTMYSDEVDWKQNTPALLVMVGVVILMGANRYIQFEHVFITETPRMEWIGLTIAIMLSSTLPLTQFGARQPRRLLPILVVGLIVLFVIIKIPSAVTNIYQGVLDLRDKESSPGLTYFSWLGFSYIAFRLIHSTLDRIAGRLRAVSLSEYVNYVLFFPTVVAGPIDRIERFVSDLNRPAELDRRDWLDAGTRFFTGMFKKFILADGLAWIALNETFARDIHSPGWTWLLLYAYSLRIFFDFSGYTDIAIGLGRFLGIRLPENFNIPYLKPNLTLFWNSWHMTLTQWFRSYFSNPLMRTLRTRDWHLPAYSIILVTQVGTMILIGLWHGITINFVLWGVWHGMGLFVQNRWSDLTRTHLVPENISPGILFSLKVVGVILTFNFVSLGWLFFILPTPDLTWSVMLKLFGVGL